MADLSLDDYIVKQNPMGFNKKRLGQKISPGKANLQITRQNITSVQRRNQPPTQQRNQPPTQQRYQQQLQQKQGTGTKFNVVGFGSGNGNVKSFDARQKLSQKRPTGHGQHLQDARQKLTQKTKPQRITGPQHIQTKPTPIARPGVPSLMTPDVRVKIQSAKAKNMDARQMIRARQQAKGNVQQRSNPSSTAPKVTVTGLSGGFNQGNRSSENGGKIIKTFSNSSQTAQQTNNNTPLRKTIRNESAVPMVPKNVGNNIVITPSNEYIAPKPEPRPVLQQQQHHPPVQYAPPAPYTEPQYSQPQPLYSQYPQQQQQVITQHVQPPPMPMIRIQNDSYRQPPVPVHIPPAPPVHHPAPAPPPQQPTYQQPYYDRSYDTREPTYDTTPAVPVTVPVQNTRAISTTRSQPSASKSVLQARLGREQTAVAPEADAFSPLQGFRVMITNLHTVVSQDDIVELFGSVGALKKARLIRPGTAEVVFISKDMALAAIKKYNNRELDGQPMQVVMTGSSSKPAPEQEPTPPLRLSSSKTSSSGDSQPIDVDIGLLHKALFKTTSKEDAPARPVTFTVKI